MSAPTLLNELEPAPHFPIPERWRQTQAPRVIAVTSGKGGVGKSNIVVNLGVALTQMGLKVLLIDADLGLANLDILLGIKTESNIYDAFLLKKSLSEVIFDGPGGIKVLPAPSGIPELTSLSDYQKLFLLTELDHYSEELDVVLIDTGAGISSNVLFFNLAARERIVVANNEPTALIDAYALIKILATRHGETRFKLLMNNLSHPREGDAAYRTLLKVTSRFLGLDVVLEYLGYIPSDPAISQAVMRQQAVLTLYPEAPASQSFIRLAQRLRDDSPPPEVAGNIKLFWRRMLQCQI